MADQQAPGNITVALLYGGTSGEREVSLMSGECVRVALEAEGYEVVPIDTGTPHFLNELASLGADVAFIALHGHGGEDGSIQGALELMGIPYTGSGVLASALAMDKAKSKLMYSSVGLQTPACEQVVYGENPDITAIATSVGLPCFVKPACDGSSLGISLVREVAGLGPALELGFAVCDRLLVERFVTGVEVTVPVLGNHDPEVLPVIEIVPVGEFYDYDSKYTEGGSQHIIPARLPQEAIEACRDAALKAHQVLGCTGVSRTDMIVDTQGVPWVIETNTIPGMTNTSLLPDAARRAGIESGALYRRLIGYALEA